MELASRASRLLSPDSAIPSGKEAQELADEAAIARAFLPAVTLCHCALTNCYLSKNVIAQISFGQKAFVEFGELRGFEYFMADDIQDVDERGVQFRSVTIGGPEIASGGDVIAVVSDVTKGVVGPAAVALDRWPVFVRDSRAFDHRNGMGEKRGVISGIKRHSFCRAEIFLGGIVPVQNTGKS